MRGLMFQVRSLRIVTEFNTASSNDDDSFGFFFSESVGDTFE